MYNLGYFTSKEEAAKARKRAEEELILPFLEENAADFPQYLARFLGKK